MDSHSISIAGRPTTVYGRTNDTCSLNHLDISDIRPSRTVDRKSDFGDFVDWRLLGSLGIFWCHSDRQEEELRRHRMIGLARKVTVAANRT